MALSVFESKENCPAPADLQDVLAESYSLWEVLKQHVYNYKPDATEEWNYAGKSFGWSFRIRDKKRVLIYLIPCKGYFKLALVYGGKATEEALQSFVSEDLKMIIRTAKVYAEGRGFRVDVFQNSNLEDLYQLIDCKLRN